MKEFLKMLSTTKPSVHVSLSYYQNENWKKALKDYLGHTAIYISNAKREPPKLVEISEIYENMVMLKETLYAKDSLPRSTVHISLNYATLVCGEAKLVIINEQ